MAGLLFAALAASHLDVPFIVDTATVAIASRFSAKVGILFGEFPALRASRLTPSDQLRHGQTAISAETTVYLLAGLRYRLAVLWLQCLE